MPQKHGAFAACAWLVLFVHCFPAAEATGQSAVCNQVPAILSELAEITGMKLHHPVPCAFITKADVNKFLKDRVKEVASPDEIRAEELTLKKFGFVPADFDLAKNTVDLLTEQAAAFYDYNKKKLFLTESDLHRIARAGAGPRVGACAGRSELQSGEIHPPGTQERRWFHRAPGRNGRSGNLADVGISGAPERAVVEEFAQIWWTQ